MNSCEKRGEGGSGRFLGVRRSCRRFYAVSPGTAVSDNARPTPAYVCRLLLTVRQCPHPKLGITQPESSHRAESAACSAHFVDATPDCSLHGETGASSAMATID